jgi:hypothetical protein
VVDESVNTAAAAAADVVGIHAEEIQHEEAAIPGDAVQSTRAEYTPPLLDMPPSTRTCIDLLCSYYWEKNLV